MKDRLATSVFWMVWSRATVQALSIVGTLFVARLLSPEDYGLMALASVWTGTITLISEMGLSATIIQFRDLDRAELNVCFWLTMAASVCGYAVLFVAAPSLAEWFGSPDLARVLRVSAVTLPLTAVRIVPDGLLRKRLSLDKVSKAEMAAVLVTLPVMVTLAWRGAGVWALVTGGLMMPLVQASVTFYFLRWFPGLRLTTPRFRELVHFSLATLGARVSWSVYEQLDTIVLGRVSGQLVVGFYSMARDLATAPVSKIAAVVNQLATPVMAEFQENRQALRGSLLKGLRLVAWAVFPLTIGSMLVTDDLVRVVLGAKWVAAAPAMQILCLYGTIRSLAILFPPVLTARYRVRFLLVCNLTLLSIMPLAFWVGAHAAGAIGVALMWVIVYPVVVRKMVSETIREMDISWDTLAAQLKPPAISVVVMAVAVLATRFGLSGWEGGVPAVRLALMVLVGASTYGATLWLIGGPHHGEIQEVAGWVIRPRGRTANV